MMKYVKASTEGGYGYIEGILWDDTVEPDSKDDDKPEWSIDAGID